MFDEVQWGTVADWVSGAGALAAASLAAVAISRDNTTRNELRGEQARAAAIAEQAQARRVTISAARCAGTGPRPPHGYGWDVVAEVSNRSDEPINEITVVLSFEPYDGVKLQAREWHGQRLMPAETVAATITLWAPDGYEPSGRTHRLAQVAMRHVARAMGS